MTIHIVCVDPDRGKHIAYDRDNPDLRGEGDSKEEALYLLLLSLKKTASLAIVLIN